MPDQSLVHGPCLGWFDMANVISFYWKNRSGGSVMLLTPKCPIKSLFVRPITDNLRTCQALQTCLAPEFTLLDSESTLACSYAPAIQFNLQAHFDMKGSKSFSG